MNKAIVWVVIIIVVAFLLWWVFGTSNTDVVVEDNPTPGTSDPMPVEPDGGIGDSANVVDVTIEASNFEYSVEEIRVKKGQSVRIELKNMEGFHDLLIDEFDVDSGRVNEGETALIQFTADEVGEFEYYCSVGNHRAQGMVGTLIVEEE